MSVVPDMFKHADGEVVVSIVGSSIDLKSMLTVPAILKEDGAIGHIQMDGNDGKHLMKRLSSKPLHVSEFENSLESKVNPSMTTEGNKIEAVSVCIDEVKDALIFLYSFYCFHSHF
jgi:hypothetical protein